MLPRRKIRTNIGIKKVRELRRIPEKSRNISFKRCNCLYKTLLYTELIAKNFPRPMNFVEDIKSAILKEVKNLGFLLLSIIAILIGIFLLAFYGKKQIPGFGVLENLTTKPALVLNPIKALWRSGTFSTTGQKPNFKGTPLAIELEHLLNVQKNPRVRPKL